MLRPTWSQTGALSVCFARIPPVAPPGQVARNQSSVNNKQPRQVFICRFDRSHQTGGHCSCAWRPQHWQADHARLLEHHPQSSRQRKVFAKDHCKRISSCHKGRAHHASLREADHAPPSQGHPHICCCLQVDVSHGHWQDGSPKDGSLEGPHLWCRHGVAVWMGVSGLKGAHPRSAAGCTSRPCDPREPHLQPQPVQQP